MRRELLGLRWENVKLSDNYIKIVETLSRLKVFDDVAAAHGYKRVDSYASQNNKTGLYLGPVKTKKSNRKIYLPDSAKQAFEDLYAIHEKYPIENEKFNPFGFVFCTDEGHPFDAKALEDEFKGILKCANLSEVNVHATRHTFATEAMQKTSDIVTVSEILGHALPSTTRNMYSHTFEDRKKALMAQFE